MLRISSNKVPVITKNSLDWSLDWSFFVYLYLKNIYEKIIDNR